MEPGGKHHAIVRVKPDDSVVDVQHLIQPVQVPSGGNPIVWEPHEFWWVQQCGNSQLILCPGVVVVLPVHHLLEMPQGTHKGVLVATLHQVIQSCYKQHSHRAWFLAVIQPPSIGQVSNRCTRYG